MKTRINLLPISRHFLTVENPLDASIAAAFVFSLIAFALLSIPRDHRSTLIQTSTKLEFFTVLRENLSATNLNEQLNDLKDNFLLNQKVKDQDLRRTFESAGLSHLLALSGGQTGPAAMVVSLFCAALFLYSLCLTGTSHKYSQIRATQCFVLLSKLLVILVLTLLFQGTGALARILSIELTLLIFLWARHTRKEIFQHNTIFIPATEAIIPWVFCALISKNPTDDLSFLLSALGSATVTFISRSLSLILNPSIPHDTPIIRRLTLKITHHTTIWVATSSLTCVAMCLFCFQLWPIGNLSQKILANLLAGPVDLFLVTPATLAVILCLILRCDLLLRTSLELLGFGLQIFLQVAESFGSTESIPRISTGLRWLRPGENVRWDQHPYLGIILITLALMVLNLWLFQRRVMNLMHPHATPKSW